MLKLRYLDKHWPAMVLNTALVVGVAELSAEVCQCLACFPQRLSGGDVLRLLFWCPFGQLRRIAALFCFPPPHHRDEDDNDDFLYWFLMKASQICWDCCSVGCSLSSFIFSFTIFLFGVEVLVSLLTYLFKVCCPMKMRRIMKCILFKKIFCLLSQY